ncbi:unnamed protein product [Periconia digitata]|uniref:Uncharacterized protein n=1 Tax=Periconia digitata TaxID=1303443 RepID=A0A9W4UNF4_9PLEO|nr:unnamed protein product [Periconia digitata]
MGQYPHLYDRPSICNLIIIPDHCLEALRVSLMCTANLGVYTFRWDSDPDRPLPKSNAERRCVDWDSLEQWAWSRKTDLKPTLLRETGQAEVIHM